MNLFVTGAAGYIGSHFIADALSEGHEVIAVDNLINSHIQIIDRIKQAAGKDFIFHKIDICDSYALKEVIKKEKIDVVVHFAALKSVPESMSNPLKYYKNNINGSMVLFELMKELSIHNIIFSSSASVYGSKHQSPIKEEFSLEPISPYAQTKVITENILTDFSLSLEEFKALNLRYFNPVGCHETFLLGETLSVKSTNLFPVVCNVAGGKKENISIFGKDYDTHDGTPIRDYIHISDLVAGHLKALDWFKKEEKTLTINLGTGIGYSVLDIINKFNSFLDQPLEFEFSPRRKGDPGSIYADVSLAKSELNWTSSKDLESMCRDAWLWYSKNSLY